jgi:DNA repair protein RecO (recombination protein O)
MSGHLDLYTRSTIMLARGRQLDIVTQADTVETFRALREDLWRTSYAHYVAELLDGFSAEALPNYPVYALAVTTFRRLASSSNLRLAVRAFELQLLGMTGYRPQLHRCLHCDATIQPQVNRFSAKMGGVLCPDCAGLDSAAAPISVPALKVLRNLQTNEGAMLELSSIDPDAVQEVEERLGEYITYRLESRPRSLAFLQRLRAEDG